MRTVLPRRSRKAVILGGLCVFVVVFYFLQSYHSPDQNRPPFAVVDVLDHPVRSAHVEIPPNIIDSHRGPHQPAAVQKHFENIHVDNPVLGALPDNAQVAQDALDAIHEAAAEDEKQQAANLAPPDGPFVNPPQQNPPAESQKEPFRDSVDDEGIPFHLTPRRPPEKSTAYSKGPGNAFLCNTSHHSLRMILFAIGIKVWAHVNI